MESKHTPPTFDRVECTVGLHFIAAIINGDTTGLTDREERQLDAFVSWITEDRPGGHWDVMTESNDMGHCLVTSRLSECGTVTYWFPMAVAA